MRNAFAGIAAVIAAFTSSGCQELIGRMIVETSVEVKLADGSTVIVPSTEVGRYTKDPAILAQATPIDDTMQLALRSQVFTPRAGVIYSIRDHVIQEVPDMGIPDLAGPEAGLRLAEKVDPIKSDQHQVNKTDLVDVRVAEKAIPADTEFSNLPRPVTQPMPAEFVPPKAQLLNPSEPPVTPFEPKFRTYEIQRGDSLYHLAQQYCASPLQWREIARLNDLKAPYKLQPGQIIKLPLPDIR